LTLSVCGGSLFPSHFLLSAGTISGVAVSNKKAVLAENAACLLIKPARPEANQAAKRQQDNF
jgi:hypothetical protein